MLPGCAGLLCWACCCFGYPCSHPYGKKSAEVKTQFNNSIMSIKGKGIGPK